MNARVSLAVFALLVLVAVLVSFLRNRNERSPRRDLFVALMAATMVLLACSALTWGLEGQPGPVVRWTLLGASALYFALQPLVTTLWMGYLWFWLPADAVAPWVVRAQGFLVGVGVGAIALNLVACFVNLGVPLFFVVDEANLYHRASYFPWSVALFVTPIVATGVYLASARGDQGRKVRAAALACSIPPTVAGVVQLVEPTLTILWPAVTLAILILYLALEAENAGLDFLTKLKNRRAFEYELARRLRDPRTGVVVVLIDLDRFKQINDLWGHAEGDRALVAAADVLQGALHHNDCIARLGGDEFAVVMRLDHTDPEATVVHLSQCFEAWNQASGTPWQLLPSIGTAVAAPHRPRTRSELMAEADRAMYQAKAARRDGGTIDYVFPGLQPSGSE